MKKRLIALLLLLVLVVPCVSASAVTWYRLKSSSRLFYLPDYNQRVLDTYRADWALTVDHHVNKSWSYIVFSNSREGYVERSHLAYSKSYSAWIKKDDTPLKHGPAYSFATNAFLAQGDKVTVLTHGRSYDYVKTSVGYGYVANSQLSKKKVKASGSTSSATYKAWVVSKGGTVGLRKSASYSNDAVIKKYQPGTELTVTKYGASFCQVKMADGKTGFMRTEYISKNKPAPVPTPAVTPVLTPYTTTCKSESGKKARLYQGCGLGWSSVVLADGTTVDVLEQAKDIYWVKVEVNGTTGYMRKQNLN